MPLHLIKLCVGVDTIDELAKWQKHRLKTKKRLYHVTRFRPKLAREILDGGSIYWIMKGYVRVRQRITGFTDGVTKERGRVCFILLDPKLVPTQLQPRRPHQGWRYFKPEDAPRDLARGMKPAAAPPPKMAAELRALGLL
jgi:hypothetical protein